MRDVRVVVALTKTCGTPDGPLATDNTLPPPRPAPAPGDLVGRQIRKLFGDTHYLDVASYDPAAVQYRIHYSDDNTWASSAAIMVRISASCSFSGCAATESGPMDRAAI